MQTNNLFEIILSRLDRLQFSVDTINVRTQKESLKPAPDPERLLDLVEAAQIVRKPVGTVRHYIHNRSLPATKIGKSYLVRFSELMKWVEEFRKANIQQDRLEGMRENRKRYGKP